MRKFILFLSAAAITAFCGCSVNSGKSVKKENNFPKFSLISNNTYKYQMLAYMNNIRAKGAKCAPPAPPLRWNPKLETAASYHVRDMVKHNFLSHTGSGTSYDPARKAPGKGSSYIDRIEFFGIPVKPSMLVGENITFTYLRNVKSDKVMPNFKKAIKNIIDDDTHCKIFMNPRFNYIGSAILRNKDRYFFVMDLAEIDESKTR